MTVINPTTGESGLVELARSAYLTRFFARTDVLKQFGAPLVSCPDAVVANSETDED